jgi:hypothetical protein
MATNAARMLANDNPADEAVEYGNSNQTSTNKPAHEFFAVLLMAAPYAHMAHLQTRSFAEHMALGTLYEELPDLVDALIESYQGKYGLVMDYPAPSKLPPLGNPVAMVTQLNLYVDQNREKVSDDSEIQNAIDEIVTLLNSTTYKLKFLA